MDTKGEGRLLVGVRVITERRRRPKRDPTDIYPVTIALEQRRYFKTQLIIQTVTIVYVFKFFMKCYIFRSHSAMLNNLQIEHGLFTGFMTLEEFIKLEVICKILKLKLVFLRVEKQNF